MIEDAPMFATHQLSSTTRQAVAELLTELILCRARKLELLLSLRRPTSKFDHNIRVEENSKQNASQVAYSWIEQASFVTELEGHELISNKIQIRGKLGNQAATSTSRQI